MIRSANYKLRTNNISLKSILLLSDTHGYIDDKILAHATKADEVWHAGDIGQVAVTDKLSAVATVRGVYGNIDDHIVRRIFPLNNVFTIEGLKVYMTHIGGYPGRYSQGVKQQLKMEKPGLFICGHSHILKVMRDPALNLLHMNPGAAGIHGFHQMRTMIRFNILEGRILEPEVIELGLRGVLPQTVG